MFFCPWLALCLLKTCVAFTATGNDHRSKSVATFSIAASKSQRDYCPGCRRPLPQCLCDHLPPDKIRLPHTRVLVLQHPAEFRRKTTSTVPLLGLVLARCRVLVGRAFGAELEAILDAARDDADGALPLLLFPGPTSLALDDPAAAARLAERARAGGASPSGSTPNPRTPPKYLLVVLDGTWTQVKCMLRDNPALSERCQSVHFAGTSDPSIYDAIRKEPDASCLSTLEACERALRRLEPHSPQVKEASRYLVRSLRAMILTQIDYEQAHFNKHPDLARNVEKLRSKRERQQQFLAKYSNVQDMRHVNNATLVYNGTLPEGYTLRPLIKSDASYVNSRWPFQTDKSLAMIERQIFDDESNFTQFQSRTCLGIEFESRLVACIIRHHNGSIGILHVDEEHRHLGLGAALLGQVTDTLLRRQEDLFAFILDGNKASEALFSKVGWGKANPSAKKGTGKRRAKRLWTYPLNKPNNDQAAT